MAQVRGIFEQVVRWRRDFHMHPEISGKEERTAGIVAAHLRGLGMEVRERVGGWGVVGLLRGAQPGETVAFRADMDALPIQEENEIDYRSKTDGVMHACGHDAHTAMLMGAASVLAGHREELRGTVMFVFQPAEESMRGARAMMEEGALEDPRPDVILGAHMLSGAPGVALRPGPAFSASDTFRLEFAGRGGHGARPHDCNDTLLAACQAVCALQNIVSRRVSPQDHAVITVGQIHSGTAFNIIPERAVIEGTVRTFRPEVRELVRRSIGETAAGICKIMGTAYKYEFRHGVDAVLNDPAVIDRVARACSAVLPEGRVYRAEEPCYGSEDFSEFFKTGIPGAYYWIGFEPLSGEVDSGHHPRYNFDEKCMLDGIAACVASILEFTGQ